MEPAELQALRGIQTPRHQLMPPHVTFNAAPEVIDLCAQAGMPLDPWQGNALHLMLGERADGLWAAFEFGLIVSRQNGKGGVIEARELGGLFLFNEPRIIHSAHASDTATEAFQRMRNIIDGSAFLSRRVKKIIEAKGQEYILLMSGQKLSYRTRTGGGGRGFSAPTIILDEAQHLTGAQIAALMPVVGAQPNPQLLYAGTVLAGAQVFRGVVSRGRKKMGHRLGYAEWSADPALASSDPLGWMQSNPALGIRLTGEYVQAEHDSLIEAGLDREFREERLGIWPEEGALGTLITLEAWTAMLDTAWAPDPDARGITIGVAVSPDREWSAVGVAMLRPDGHVHVELIAYDRGTDWLVPYLVDLHRRRQLKSLLIDQQSPAATFITPLVASSLPVRVTTTAEYKTAVAAFVDRSKAAHARATGQQQLTAAQELRHRGQVPLTQAANGVQKHDVGESGFVYARRDSGVVVAPLEAVTLAAFGLAPAAGGQEFFVFNLNDYAGSAQ